MARQWKWTVYLTRLPQQNSGSAELYMVGDVVLNGASLPHSNAALIISASSAAQLRLTIAAQDLDIVIEDSGPVEDGG